MPDHFDMLRVMTKKRALIILQQSWLKLNLHQFLDKYKPDAQAVFIVDVLDMGYQQGLCVSSVAADLAFGTSEIFIPWKYIEGLVWNDEFTKAEHEPPGFTPWPHRMTKTMPKPHHKPRQ